MHLRIKIACLLMLLLTVGCWANTIMLDDFEVEDVNQITGDQLHPATTLSLSMDRPFSGKSCATIHYRLGIPSRVQTVQLLVAPNRIYAPVRAISLAARSTGSRNILWARFADAHNEIYQFYMGQASSTDWTEITTDLTVPTTMIFGGDKNRTMDYPIRLQSIVIEKPAEVGTGEIAVDAVRLGIDGNDDTAVEVPSCMRMTIMNYDSSKIKSCDPSPAHPALYDYEGWAVTELDGEQLQPETTISLIKNTPLNGDGSLQINYRFLPHIQGTQNVRIMGPLVEMKEPVHRFWMTVQGDREGANIALFLRVTDVTGECLQHGLGIVQGPDTQTLCVDLDEAFDASWGGNSDKVLQYPIQHAEIIIDPVGLGNDPIEGSVLFDDLMVLKEKTYLER